MRISQSATLLFLFIHVWTCSAYELVREYAGSTFFDRWDFYGFWDNLTLGDVNWLDRPTAFSSGLAYVDPHSGNAIIRVDNSTNVPWNDKRDSVRITSSDSYNVGSLWVLDLVHLPFGCSVWPAFWTKGPLWPDDGEIDIIEGVNLMSANQMALHTTAGCYHSTPPQQLGTSNAENSDGEDTSDCSTPSGCTVTETKEASFGSAFALQGGGVWAVQFDVAGVYIWYFPRSQIPASIQALTSTSGIESLDDWGMPSAAYPNTSCDFTQSFTGQQLVFDMTLCGDWAGVDAVYNATCANTGPTGQCYMDNVIGSGSNYDDAYFEIRHLRAYTTAPGIVSPTAAFAHDEQPSGLVSGATAGAGRGGGEWRTWACVFLGVGAWVGGVLVL
ncbi:hypothetical protein ACEPAH_1841 [Sanghuangporus vaninii]